LAAGTPVIFPGLDWVPANYAQTEDRCYRLGQKNRVTGECYYGGWSLDEYISELLSLKIALIGSVEAEVAPDASFLAELESRLRAIAPALMREAKLAKSDPKDRLAELTALLPKAH
jgi:SWI/SNF-related matrix-associated actin-dependent regulator of chromatin subfamily A-like protein 1